jgi:hypothetical protein
VYKISAWKEFFFEQGTAIASVAIALMALCLTLYNAKLDRDYKELSIRPFLHLKAETSDFHVGIINMGVGPAEIKEVATKFEPDRCTIYYRRPSRPTDPANGTVENALRLLPPINAYFADPLDRLLQPDSVWDLPRAPRLYVRTLTPGEIVPPGQEVIIFEMQKDTLELMLKKLQTLSGADYSDVNRRFIVRAQTMPFYLHFCSLTGDYCVNQIEEHCGNDSKMPEQPTR